MKIIIQQLAWLKQQLQKMITGLVTNSTEGIINIYGVCLKDTNTLTDQEKEVTVIDFPKITEEYVDAHKNMDGGLISKTKRSGEYLLAIKQGQDLRYLTRIKALSASISRLKALTKNDLEDIKIQLTMKG